MSHGNTEKCEPNLTPLLDLVLQLVMFFMISANFVMEQANAEIRLPDAVATKPLPEGPVVCIFLNINAKGQVLLPPIDREGSNDTLDNPAQVEGYMMRRAAAELIRTKQKQPETMLVLRIDKQCPFEKTYPIMTACRKAGYTNVQLRASRAQGPV